MGKVLHHLVRLRCDRKRAFKMFTVNENLQSWLTGVVDVEPERVGGMNSFGIPMIGKTTARLAAESPQSNPTGLFRSDGRGLSSTSTS